MRVFLLLTLALTLCAGLSAQVLTCRQVQETTASNGDSPYNGQVVTVQGIVTVEQFFTGTNVNYYGFVISDPDGGPWSGLLIFTNQYFPSRGDLVQVSGTITEYFNFTEMSPTSTFQVISQGNPLPPATLITTSQLSAANGERWESVLVKVENVTVTTAPTATYYEFQVNDGSGACQIDDQCFPRPGYNWPGVAVGQTWARIQGVVDYANSNFAINPRDLTDMVRVDDVSSATLRIQSTEATINELVTVPILTSRVKLEWGISSWKAKIKIDSDKVNFHNLDFTDAMSDASLIDTLYVSADGDTITIEYQSLMDPVYSSVDDRILFSLVLEPKTYGEIILQIVEFYYDNTPVLNLTSGKLMVKIQEKIAWLNISNSKNTKNIFNPALNEKITIEYGVKSSSTGINARAYVRIYDVQGRLVATPVNKLISNALGIESYQWDGRDTNMKVLPVGMYYCHFEVVERSTGKKETTVQPIVIKSIMK